MGKENGKTAGDEEGRSARLEEWAKRKQTRVFLMKGCNGGRDYFPGLMARRGGPRKTMSNAAVRPLPRGAPALRHGIGVLHDVLTPNVKAKQ